MFRPPGHLRVACAAVAVAAAFALAVTPLGSAYAASGPKPVVTPDQARAIATSVAAAQPSTTQALSKVEAGPAFAIDNAALVALKTAGQPAAPGLGAPTGVQVFVPRQSSYPATFLAVAHYGTFSLTGLFERTGRGVPWKGIAYAASAAPPAAGSLPTPDSSGYVPAGSLKGLAYPADQMAKFLCPFLQNPSDRSNPITDSGGTLTQLAQASVGPGFVVVGDQSRLTCASTQRSVPLVSLAVGSGTLIETTLRYTTTATAGSGPPIKVISGNPASPPPHGRFLNDYLKPGRYGSVTQNSLVMVFMVVPTTSNKSSGITAISTASGTTTATGKGLPGLPGPGATCAGIPHVGIDLHGCDLSDTNLTNANLTNANLTGADLTFANLTNAHLTNANLTNAHLAFANLTGATLTGATLTGVTWSYTTCPNGTIPPGHGLC